MAEGKFVSYFRVSTARQGVSGLGIEAQQKAVADFLNGGNWTVAAEFTEVESGKRADRPELAKAIAACRVYGARLVIAKLDRLSRDAHFLLGLEKAGVDFVAADMPNANRLTVGIMAMVAEEERRMISARTKAALAAAKARGTKLGGFRGYVPSAENVAAGVATRQATAAARARDLMPVLDELKAGGHTSLGALSRELTARGVPTARGNTTWTPMQVKRVLSQIEPAAATEAEQPFSIPGFAPIPAKPKSAPVEFRGRMMSLSEAVAEAGNVVTLNHARSRIRGGMAVERAVTEPVRGGSAN